jgi:uncharacterized protein with GYD domain
MSTYFFFGRYSESALKEISAKRTEKAATTIQKFGGEVKSVYALLGEHDLVIIAEVPGTEAAMQCSLALHKLTGIAFTTAPAVSVDQFDKLAAEV